jgi:hypothetical protein
MAMYSNEAGNDVKKLCKEYKIYKIFIILMHYIYKYFSQNIKECAPNIVTNYELLLFVYMIYGVRSG